ncbi:MAG: phosphoesterase PA-phosphatase related protein [Gemmatimonadetes bacterium]|nr:phosphoesterase PA-phosphatase related protein [Gemmatimonadota bacterium]
MMIAGPLRRAVLVMSMLLATRAQAQADTAPSTVSLFTYRDVALAGAVSVMALLARPFDENYSKRLQDSSTQANRQLHTVAQIVRTTTAPGAVIIGSTMYVVGRITKQERMTELGLRGSEALVLGEVVGGVMKGLIGRQRPYVMPQNSHSFGFMRGFTNGDSLRSFPSGHSLAAFAAAAAVTSEMAGWYPSSRWLVGGAMYGGATLTGLSRMYDNRHWATDVIVGAGIGTFAGLKVVRYHHAHPRTFLDRWLLRGSITPNADGGSSLHWSIVPGAALPSR